MFITKSTHKETNFFEAKFEPRHFKHLTGVKVISQDIHSSVEFYMRCLERRIALDDIKFINDGTTDKKIEILPDLMKISTIAKMIGEYNNSKPLLYTEKLSGTITACLGFVKDGKYYVPNTSLKEDIRNISCKPTQSIIAIFQKKIKRDSYNHITYLAKGISLDALKLPMKIWNKVDCNDLIIDFKKAKTHCRFIFEDEEKTNQEVEEWEL